MDVIPSDSEHQLGFCLVYWALLADAGPHDSCLIIQLDIWVYMMVVAHI